MNLTEFDIKTLKFFDRYSIKSFLNKKGKPRYNKEFHIDENNEYQLGGIPPLTHYYNLENGEVKEVKVCKFCWNELPAVQEKGHIKVFCEDKCKKSHWKIKNLVEQKRKEEPDIIMINWEPELIKNESFSKDGKSGHPKRYKVPERIIMKVVRNGKPSKEDWESLSTRKRSKQDDF